MNTYKKYFLLFLFIVFMSVGVAQKNYYTTIGLGFGPSLPVGTFSSRDINNNKAGYAAMDNVSFKFIIEQNIGSRLGISMNFYTMYHPFDVSAFENSLHINNRGLNIDPGMKYEIKDTTTEWEVSVGNIGVYYYKYFGKHRKFHFKGAGAITITDMISPAFDVNIKDSSNNLIETNHVENVHSWREVFLFPPVDGFSLTCNISYFFSKHFSVNASMYYVNCSGWFDGRKKALIYLSNVPYQAINFSLGISYTIYYKKYKVQ